MTTSLAQADWNHQSVLWVYSVCNPGSLEPCIAVSLGSGSLGNVPTITRAKGMIALVRLTGSMAGE